MLMKTVLLFALLLITLTSFTQITTPIIKAGFGVDADLKGRMLNGALQTSDDWYMYPVQPELLQTVPM
jgi:hypothetical protein